MAKYYHVRLTVRGQKHDETKVDLDSDTLERQFLMPYRSGRPITVNGKTIPIADVDRIRVSQSTEPSSALISLIKSDDSMSNIVRLGGPGYGWRAAARAEDVTDQFIVGPSSLLAEDPGVDAQTGVLQQAEPTQIPPGPNNSVFVIAGRDHETVASVVLFLRALGLGIVEWEHAVAKTGLPSPYVGDVVDAGLRMAGAAVVILTPDDLVRLRDDLVGDDDGPQERETGGQARPNVYYEAGIADTLGRDRTIIVEVGRVKSFSDILGRHVVRYDGSAARRNALASRLTVANLAVDKTGDDWLTVGQLKETLMSGDGAAVGNIGGTLIDKSTLVERISDIIGFYDSLQARSMREDLSDLPDESLEFVYRAQAVIDDMPQDSTVAVEAAQVRTHPTFLRIPVLNAALRALRATELEQ